MILMLTEENEGFWFCQKCGIDIPYYPEDEFNEDGLKYDEYWTDGDESEVMDELDEYFYKKYPQFRRDH